MSCTQELIEKVFNISVYARRSIGACRCLLRVDGTKYLIWNLGQGRFIDFTLLFSYLQKWINSGLKIYALWKSILNLALSCGISCTLTYDDLHRSVCGFMNNLDIDFKRAFSCPTLGSSPTWVVSDEKFLVQSTKSKYRAFLSSKKERLSVCELLTGELFQESVK